MFDDDVTFCWSIRVPRIIRRALAASRDGAHPHHVELPFALNPMCDVANGEAKKRRGERMDDIKMLLRVFPMLSLNGEFVK